MQKISEELPESNGKVEHQSRKTSEAQLKAIRKYETEKVKRINCRIPKELWEKVERTGESANAVIIQALTDYLTPGKVAKPTPKLDLDALLKVDEPEPEPPKVVKVDEPPKVAHTVDEVLKNGRIKLI